MLREEIIGRITSFINRGKGLLGGGKNEEQELRCNYYWRINGSI